MFSYWGTQGSSPKMPPKRHGSKKPTALRADLAHFNKAFKEAASPDSWKTADIVMIFKGKKKDPKLPESYRPIPLINTVYRCHR